MAVVVACPAEDSTLAMLAAPPVVVVVVEAAAVAAKSTLPTSVHSVRDVLWEYLN